MVLAELRESQEKFAEAEDLYREVLKKDDHNVAVLNNLACLLALSGRQLDEAKGLIDKAIATAGPQASPMDTRATIYLALGQADKALADMRMVVNEQPAPNRFFHLALVQKKLAETQADAREALKYKTEATDSLTKARSMQPPSGVAPSSGAARLRRSRPQVVMTAPPPGDA